ncbi:MAG: glutamate ligase domain-containing protein, partial [Bellilinea sp.]
PGRFEILRKEPLVIIDSAHNLDSAEKLAQTVRDYLPGRPLKLLFGASEDKDVAGMFKVLAPTAERIIVTQSFHPRSFDPTQLAEIAREYFAVVDMIPKLESALDLALKQIARGGVLLITGSIFVAAGARQYLVDQDTTS